MKNPKDSLSNANCNDWTRVFIEIWNRWSFLFFFFRKKNLWKLWTGEKMNTAMCHLNCIVYEWTRTILFRFVFNSLLDHPCLLASELAGTRGHHTKSICGEKRTKENVPRNKNTKQKLSASYSLVLSACECVCLAQKRHENSALFLSMLRLLRLLFVVIIIIIYVYLKAKQSKERKTKKTKILNPTIITI